MQEYWIVDPWEKRIVRLVLKQQGYGAPAVLAMGDVLTTPLLPGLVIDLHRVFENPLIS